MTIKKFYKILKYYFSEWRKKMIKKKTLKGYAKKFNKSIGTANIKLKQYRSDYASNQAKRTDAEIKRLNQQSRLEDARNKLAKAKKKNNNSSNNMFGDFL